MSTTDSKIYNQNRDWYWAFLANTNQKKVTIDAMVEDLPKQAPEIFLNAEGPHHPIKILDIGTGAGRTLIDFAVRALPGPKIFTIHEPNLGSYLYFLKHYRMLNQPFNRLFIYDNQDSDSFVKTQLDDFDIITASHTFYYIADWRPSLQDLYHSLVSGGVAIIALTSEKGPLYKLRKEFFPKLGVTELGEIKPHSGEDLCAILTELSIPYESQTLYSRTKIDSILRGEEQGKKLASFFLRTDWNTIPKKIQQEFLERLKDLADKTYLPFQDRLIWFRREGEYKPRKNLIQESIPEDRDLDLMTIVGLKNLLKKPIRNSLDPSFVRLHPELRSAYLTVLLFDGMLSDPELRDFAMKEGGVLAGVFGYSEDYGPIIMYQHPDCFIAFPEGVVGKNAQESKISEFDAMHYLSDIVRLYSLVLVDKGNFDKMGDFENWLIGRYKRFGEWRLFNLINKSLFLNLQSAPKEIGEKIQELRKDQKGLTQLEEALRTPKSPLKVRFSMESRFIRGHPED